MREYDPEWEAEASRSVSEMLREEAILARLDPDRLGTEAPPGVPADEWAEFVALCDRLDAEE